MFSEAESVFASGFPSLRKASKAILVVILIVVLVAAAVLYLCFRVRALEARMPKTGSYEAAEYEGGAPPEPLDAKEQAAVDEILASNSDGKRAKAPPRDLAEIPDPGFEFRRIPKPAAPALHYGQRKLLLTEVDFLTRHGDKGARVVYAGAAPGFHIPALLDLFPAHEFHLYDPMTFKMSLTDEQKGRVTVHNELLTADAIRGRYDDGTPTLFISDIRGGTDARNQENPGSQSASAAVESDMQAQADIVRELKAPASQLKFRLPWGAGTTKYPRGELRLQPWAPLSTNETRLEVVGPKLTAAGKFAAAALAEYDHAEYDRKLHLVNAFMRTWGTYGEHVCVDASGDAVPGHDRCYDCQLECAIWEDYRAARAAGRVPGFDGGDAPTCAELMAAATEATRQRLDNPPHGMFPDVLDARERLEKTAAACKDRKHPVTGEDIDCRGPRRRRAGTRGSPRSQVRRREEKEREETLGGPGAE